ncbi:uncharacterized protein BO72DRAFT_302349 [Aspergillus fijiensis CBS 313.89]|uniref:Uncharacterized protein n=1 Tax=Aspergillus fijiensis CBS 313.89 TaxID=1448319 RepID=A0A8G1RW76_9EURO|nr:uncharacterized protein BO72DRAFT_302349 [Aspergillus fijiensis CBS 313.89]RAK80334.1 hypothetical protein BO72DRAFT_302349 [Aspergillus fijiensis CBS 313.89]
MPRTADSDVTRGQTHPVTVQELLCYFSCKLWGHTRKDHTSVTQHTCLVHHLLESPQPEFRRRVALLIRSRPGGGWGYCLLGYLVIPAVTSLTT